METIGPGGVEQRRLSMARYLDKDRYEQVVACARIIGGFDQRLEAEGARVEVLGVMGSPFNLRYFIKLVRLVRQVRPHIIHGAVFEGVISAVVGGLLCRVPVIVIEETSEPANRSWRGHALFRILARFAQAVVATSPAVHTYLTEQLGITSGKVHLILNGVEAPIRPPVETVAEKRRKFGLTDESFVIGSVGRMLDDHKLFSVLLRAFKEFSDGRPEARLLLVGDGVDRKSLEALSQDLRLYDSVIFAGHQSDVAGFYALMNVFALVPAREGFGLAAVEAMFMGLPVIASRVGGLKNIVMDGVTGILVEPGDIAGLAGALIQLYESPQTANALGLAGHQRADERYTAQRYVDDISALYQRLSNTIQP